MNRMRKKQFGRKIAAIAMATAMAISAAFSGGVNGGTRVHAAPVGAPMPARMDSVSSVNYSSILGRAVDYGIVADHFKQMSHMQTTFAIKNFANWNPDVDDINLLDKDTTGHVMLANINLDNSGGYKLNDQGEEDLGEYKPQPVSEDFAVVTIGSKSCDTLIFEGPKSILQGSHVNTVNLTDKGGLVWKYNESTEASIDLIRNKAYKTSKTLEDKCLNPDYQLDYKKYMTDDKTLDVTGSQFVNKVVYVYVDNDLLKKIGQADGLVINKDPSTVVVFTINDDSGANYPGEYSGTELPADKVRLEKYGVRLNGGELHSTDNDSSFTDEEICQKIIWNITTTKMVQLCNTAALVIIPKAKVDIRTTSRGWIVTDDLSNSNGEWHYIYKGKSQTVNEDEGNQMHFSIRKALTRDWGSVDPDTGYTRPEEDSSVFIGGGDYTFEFYEAPDFTINPNISTTGLVKIDEVSNQDTSYVKLPVLTFYTSEEEAQKDPDWNQNTKYIIEKNKSQTFYYLIKEKNAGKTVNNVELSKGYVNIKLFVENKDNVFYYTVSTNTYLGDDNHSTYFTNNDVVMSGIEFDLDDFFNKIGKNVQIDKVAIAGGDEIDGAKLTITCLDDGVYPFGIVQTPVRRDDGTIIIPELIDKEYVALLSGAKGISYTTEAGKHTVISSLPRGNYSITETTVPDGFERSETIYFSIDGNGVVSSKNADVNANVITMVDKVKVNVVKVDEYNNPVTGATLQILDKNKKVVSTVTGDTVALEAGEYYLHEENAPEGYKKAEDIAFTVDSDGKIYDADGKEFANKTIKMVDEHVTDFYISKVSVTGSANDELKGATISLTGKDYNNEDIIFESNNVVAGQGASIETTLPSKEIVFISGTSSTLFKNLPDGNYEMKELVAPTDYSKITTTMEFTIKNGVVTSSHSNVSIRTNSSDSKQVVVMADNLAEKGNLKITKTIDGKNVTSDDLENLKFTVQNETGKYLYKDADGKVQTSTDKVEIALKSFTEKDGTYTYSFDGIPVGDYKVKETQANIAGYDIEYVKINGSEVKADTDKAYGTDVALTKDGKTVTIEDAYRKIVETGDLEITKTIDGKNVTDDDLENLKFTVQNAAGEYLYKDASGNVKTSKDKVEIALKEFSETSGTYTYKFDDIPVGDYKVKETQANIAGYDIEYVKINGSEVKADTDKAYGTDVALTKDGKTVTIEDAYRKIVETGDLEITKTIDGKNVTDDDLENLKFTVQNAAGEYLYKDASGNVKTSKDKVEIALKEFSETSGTYTYKFDDIPVGDYKVKETQANIAGYDIEYVKINGSEVKADTDKAYGTDVALTKDGKTVTIEDAYRKIVETGDLEITKTIDGKNVTDDDLENLKFTVQNAAGEYLYKDASGNVKTSKDKVEIALKEFSETSGTYTYKFDDIPVGDYKVKETQANIAGYDIEYVKINGSEVKADTDKAYGTDVALTKDGKTVTIEDAYRKIVETGDLEITKTIDGKNVTSDDLENLKFTVQNETGKYLYKDADGKVQTSTDKVEIALKSFTEKDGTYTYSFDGIPVGDYKVKETQANIAGYDIEYVKINGSEVKADTDKAYGTDVVLTKDGKTVKIEDKYKEIVETGELKITKTIDGKNITSDDFENLKFTVQNKAGEYLYKDDVGKVQTSTDKKEIALKSFTEKDGTYTYSFSGIPVGDYKVKETQANIAGYDIEYVKINDSAATADTDKAYGTDVVLTKDGKTVKIEDKYKEIVETGELKITKTIDGKNVTSDDLENLKFTVQNKAGEYLYKDADGKVQTSTDKVEIALKSFTEKDGTYTYSFSGIPVGDYKVKETQANITGYDIEYVKINDSAVTADTDKAYGTDVVLTKDGKTVKIEDKYKEIVETGELKITKTIDGKNVTSDDLENLKFTVQNKAGEYLYKDDAGKVQTSTDKKEIALKSFTEKDGTYTYSFSGIPVGDYKVKETQANITGYDIEYVKINDSAVTADTDKAYGTDVVLTKDGKTVKIEDKYKEIVETGELKITKTIDGKNVTSDDLENLKFTVQNKAGEYLYKDDAGKVQTSTDKKEIALKSFTEKDGTYTYSFSGIPVGDYKVKETQANIAGYDIEYVKINDSAVTADTDKAYGTDVVLTKDGKTVKIEDKYKEIVKTGSLVITKSFDGENVTEEEAKGALTFTVKNADGKWLDTDGKVSDTEVILTLENDFSYDSTTNKWTKTFTNIPAGVYTVTEVDTEVPGYKFTGSTVAGQDGKTADVTVEADKEKVAEIINSYKKEVGSLVITKSFANDCITEEEKEGGLQFTVTTVKDSVKYYLKGDGTLTTDETVYTLKPDFTYDSGNNTWTKTFNNVPAGTYTVDEVNTTIEGYKFKGSTYNGANGTESSARKITVEADKEATENIVDDYEEVASITVKKAVTDAEAATAAAGKVYSIALKDADGKYYNGTEFTTSEKYYDITTTEPVTWKNLTVGKTYTIVENYGQDNAKVNITGFTFNGFTAAPIDLTKDATVTVTNDYTRDKGNLVITKLVKGPVTDDEFNGKLTFKVVDENGKTLTVTKNDGTTGTTENMTLKDYFQLVSSSNGEFKYELKIENVPTGKYTVTETNSTFEGYELVSQTGGGDTNVVKNADAISNFVDEYKQETGSLEIVKNFKDAPSNLDASKIEFEIEGPKLFNNNSKLTVTYDKFKDGKYVIDNAPIGTYTVTETSRQDSLVDGVYRYTFSTGASTVDGSAKVIKDTKSTITLQNVYDKEEILGSLSISKTVSMNDGSAIPADTFVSDKAFKVSVQNTDTGLYVADVNGKYSENPVWFEIKAGNALKINNIKLGNYTVSEDVADATRVDYRIIYDGSASVSEDSVKLTTDNKDGSAALSNVYKHYEEEEIIDYPVFFSKEDSLSGAEVAGAEIALYKGDKAEGTPYKTWTSTLTSHVENLEEGTYTFKETVAPTGYDIVETAITFTVEKDETADKGYSVKLIDLSDEICYQRQDGTLVLKDDPMLGILKVVKVVETDTGNKPVVNGFNVTVKNLKNNKYVQNIDGQLGDDAKDIFVPIDSTGVGSVEITGLRPARYLVIEKEGDKAIAGFIYDANGSIAELEEEIALTSSGATTAEIELANKYVEDIGNLEITKTITGDNPGKTEFKVTVKDADGKYLAADGKLSTDEVVLTVKAGETLTIKNVPSGKYTVTEDVADAANVTGYKFNSDNSVTGKDATVTYGNTAAVELTNDYTEVPTGHLYVHVKEEKSGKDVPDATVKATNKTTGETKTYKTNAKGEIVDENGNTPELPVGDYTVVVSDVPKGYEVTTGESADVTVPKNDTGKHEAIIKTVRGGIIITVYDEETGDVVPGAEVTITTPDGVTGTFITDSDGQVKEYAKKDQFGNYTQLPGTFTYVVTKVPDGYKVTTGESQTGTVIAEKLTELEARIAPKTGGLDIKVIDEKTEKPVPNATVEVITPDGTKVVLTTDENGMITKFAEKDATGKYTAKVGEYKITVTKVPEGYSVTTGQTKIETVVEGEVKHHIAKIATATKKVITDTTSTNTTNKTNTTKKTDTNAKMGDATSVAGIMALMLLALCGIGFIIRRKKEDEK